MPATGLDVNRGHRPHWHEFPIQFQMPLTLEHEINLCHPLMVVNLGVLLDLDLVQTGHRPGSPANARLAKPQGQGVGSISSSCSIK